MPILLEFALLAITIKVSPTTKKKNYYLTLSDHGVNGQDFCADGVITDKLMDEFREDDGVWIPIEGGAVVVKGTFEPEMVYGKYTRTHGLVMKKLDLVK